MTTYTANKKKFNLTLLPHDLLLNCLAHVSRSYYPTLSLVSKSFRSMIASPDLYKARSLLNCTENCLYLCIKVKTDSHRRYFTLLRNTDSSGYFLATFPIRPPPVNLSSGLVSVGSNIYCIKKYSNILLILDCQSHTWREGPSLPVKLSLFRTSVLDGKIYVAGRCEGSFKSTIQVFDTETQVWNPLPLPYSDDTNFMRSTCVNGKFHVVFPPNASVVAYDSKESRWDLVGPEMASYMNRNYYNCEIGKVLCSVVDGSVEWYDNNVSKWRKVLGLKEVHLGARPKLADFGGNVVVLWHEKQKMIFCVEISLERRTSGEIWGKVLWRDKVLTLPLTNFVLIGDVVVATL